MTILSLEALFEQCEGFRWVFEQPLLAVTSSLKRESFAKTSWPHAFITGSQRYGKQTEVGQYPNSDKCVLV